MPAYPFYSGLNNEESSEDKSETKPFGSVSLCSVSG